MGMVMEKIWLKHYPLHVPEQIDLHQYQSLVDLFEQSCRQYTHLPALQNYGEQLTFQELDLSTQALAAFFQQVLRLKVGTRVAIVLPNCLQYPVALFGILRAGLCVVNINPMYTADEVNYLLVDAKPEAAIVFANVAHTVAKAIANTSVKHIIVTELGDLFPAPKRWLFNGAIKYIKRLIPEYHFTQSCSLRQGIARGKKLTLQTVTLTQNDLALLQYTGGTTGKPKGAMLTHGNLLANVLQAYAWMKPVLKPTEEIAVTPLPLYHIFSFTANCLMFLLLGCLNVLITDPRDTKSFCQTLAKIPFTVITGVNTLFNSLLHSPAFSQLNFSQLHLCVGGGMSIQRWVAEQWYKVTGCFILEGYGLTEASPIVTINPITLTEYNGSIGMPLSSTEVSIRDIEANELGIDQPGELWVRGPQVMQGYWQNPEETANVLTADGWLRTGDIATINEQGFIRIVDRMKDMILVSGFNVYPNEIEATLISHPKVMEVGVVGEVSRSGQEMVSAYIVKREADLNVPEVLEFCREHLAAYKVPKKVTFVDVLPKSHVGKILRRELSKSA